MTRTATSVGGAGGSKPAPAAAGPSAFEKLGVFYLGRPYDLGAKKSGEGLVLYDAKDLVTHAVCVGMRGSGYPVPRSFDLERCSDDGESAPCDWARVGALPLSPCPQGDFPWV